MGLVMFAKPIGANHVTYLRKVLVPINEADITKLKPHGWELRDAAEMDMKYQAAGQTLASS